MIRGLQVAAFAAALMAGTAVAQQSGTTSGPATGTQTTLGTGGQTSATPHQTSTVRNQGGSAVQSEQKGQLGGNNATIVPGAPGAESGPNPAPGQRPASR